jgi:hypothetical protein
MVGRLVSSAGVLVVVVLVVRPLVVEESELSDLRFMVGRSGSSSGVLPVDAGVLSVVELSDLRFMVGRSGSSDVVDAGVVEDVVDGVVVPELEESEERRFMVGRSGSSLVVVELVAVWVLAFSVAELWRTGRVLEGFRAATFLGAARGLTVP